MAGELGRVEAASRWGLGGSTKPVVRFTLFVLIVGAGLPVGCSPRQYREQADRAAYEIIRDGRRAALGHDEPFSIEQPSTTLRRRILEGQELPRADAASMGAAHVPPIPQWPDPSYRQSDPVSGQPEPAVDRGPLRIGLVEALQLGARNSREYQSQKEAVFQVALRLDLARDDFRNTFSAGLDGEITRDLGLSPPETGVRGSGAAGVTRQLRNGLTFAANLGVDLVKLLTGDHSSSLGVFGDATVSLPLLRGSGRFVVTEPLAQAERDVVYAIYEFERFKREFAVRVASDYLGVLRQLDQVRNAEENYRGLIRSTRRAHRLSSAGRLPEIQVDQSRQDELSARNRWISAQQAYEATLDRFKTLLGVPTDAAIELDSGALDRLGGGLAAAEAGAGPAAEPSAVDPAVGPADAAVVLLPPSTEEAGPLEFTEEVALRLALDNRLDLRTAIGRVFDSQRAVAVAADNLRADVTLLGTGSAGGGRSVATTESSDAALRPERGRYSALLDIDLPFERTAERNGYRNSLIGFEQSVRDVQELEDQIKFQVRDDLRNLLEARETLRIQRQAVTIAERRVESTDLFLQAGRAETRDLLEAQEALIAARNALTSARVQYRVSELELQRDLDILEVDEQGMWREFVPEARDP
ncbi:MAG: TolC family protein [Planctomycetota bacterium]